MGGEEVVTGSASAVGDDTSVSQSYSLAARERLRQVANRQQAQVRLKRLHQKLVADGLDTNNAAAEAIQLLSYEDGKDNSEDNSEDCSASVESATALASMPMQVAQESFGGPDCP